MKTDFVMDKATGSLGIILLEEGKVLVIDFISGELRNCMTSRKKNEVINLTGYGDGGFVDFEPISPNPLLQGGAAFS